MTKARVPNVLAAMSTALVTLAGTSVILIAGAGPAAADQDHPSVNFAAEAQRVAHAMVSARTSAQREKALEALFSALGVQTIDYRGRAVTRRPDGGMNLYVYPYEVTLEAGDDGAHKVVTAATVAQVLSFAFASTHKTVSATWVATTLRSAAKAAVAHPRSQSSLTMLVLRDLGVLRSWSRSNLLTATSKDLRLDWVQLQVLLLDLVAMVTSNRALPRVATAGAQNGIEPSAGQQPAGSGCTTWEDRARDRIADHVIEGAAEHLFGEEIEAGGLVKMVEAAAHGTVIAQYTKYTAVPPHPSQTKYGTEVPGAPLDFGIHVEFTAALKAADVNCGDEDGFHTPQKGPIGHVPVQWVAGDLGTHGTLTCVPANCETAAAGAQEGTAIYHFHPKQEIQPYNSGPELKDEGTVHASPQVVSTMTSPVPGIGENINLLLRAMPWTVTWHEPHPTRIVYTLHDVETITAAPYDPCGVGGTFCTETGVQNETRDVTYTSTIQLTPQSFLDSYAGDADVSGSGSEVLTETIMTGDDSCPVDTQTTTLTGFHPGRAHILVTWDPDHGVITGLAATAINDGEEDYGSTDSCSATSWTGTNTMPFYSVPPFGPQGPFVDSGWHTSPQVPDALGIDTQTWDDSTQYSSQAWTVTIEVLAN